ncbi:MAG: C4-dicarboxylate ABC transporter, partial [Macromonas sp.]
MPVPAIPDSLSKGVIDGAVLPYQVGPSIKVDELTKFSAEPDSSGPGLYTSVFIMAMNPARYNSLPPDLQKVIDKNSGRTVSARFGKIVGDDDAVGKQKFLTGKGNTVYIVPATEIAQWRKASETVMQQWLEEMGKKGVDGKALLTDAQTLIARHSKK